MEYGADINKENDVGFTPLYIACQNGHTNIIKYLVEHGADINKEDKYGETPIYVANQNGYEEILKYLIYKIKEKMEILNNESNIEKDVIYKIYEKTKLNSRGLHILIESCVPFLNTSSYLIKELMDNNNREFLEILFKSHLKFFDNFLLLNFLIITITKHQYQTLNYTPKLIIINIKFQQI